MGAQWNLHNPSNPTIMAHLKSSSNSNHLLIFQILFLGVRGHYYLSLCHSPWPSLSFWLNPLAFAWVLFHLLAFLSRELSPSIAGLIFSW